MLHDEVEPPVGGPGADVAPVDKVPAGLASKSVSAVRVTVTSATQQVRPPGGTSASQTSAPTPSSATSAWAPDSWTRVS